MPGLDLTGTSADTAAGTPAVPLAGGDGKPPVSGPSRRRLPPSPAEQARRKAWGREWGKVGAAYKRRRLLSEGR